jgi:hypothetical protein
MEIGIQTGSIEVNMDVFKRFGKTERKMIFPVRTSTPLLENFPAFI